MSFFIKLKKLNSTCLNLFDFFRKKKKENWFIKIKHYFLIR